jgi:hypothetical protein
VTLDWLCIERCIATRAGEGNRKEAGASRLLFWATRSEVAWGSGGPRSCSRVASVAEVDRRRLALLAHE